MTTDKNMVKTCSECNTVGFFVATPNGGDYTTCPLCAQYNDDECEFDLYFCSSCKILYDLGCRHSHNGCTDDIWNAMLMTEFTHQGKTHKGMLVFDDDKSAVEFRTLISNGKLQAKFQCMCGGKSHTCKKASYPMPAKEHTDRITVYGKIPRCGGEITSDESGLL